MVGSLDGLVSGNFDIGDILKDSILNEALINGFGGVSPNLTMAGILNGAIDGAISSGLSSAVYGTDFLEGLSASMVRTLVNLTLADVQYEMGELGIVRDANGNIIDTNDAWEGSVAHALLHGIAGRAAGAALNGGQGCAAGAAGAVAQSLVSGAIKGEKPLRSEFASDEVYSAAYDTWVSSATMAAALAGASAGFLFSGGDGDNVSNASAIAQSGFENNYLTHTEMVARLTAEKALSACEAKDASCSSERMAELRHEVERLTLLDELRDLELKLVCGTGNRWQCAQLLQRSYEAALSYQAAQAEANRKGLSLADYVASIGGPYAAAAMLSEYGSIDALRQEVRKTISARSAKELQAIANGANKDHKPNPAMIVLR